jgi:hypothetical protein
MASFGMLLYLLDSTGSIQRKASSFLVGDGLAGRGTRTWQTLNT